MGRQAGRRTRPLPREVRGRAGKRLKQLLLWDLEWGPELEDLRKQWKDTKVKPKALEDRPKLLDEDTYYYRCFWELHRSRARGEAVSFIAEDQFESWCNNTGVATVTARDRHRRAIFLLDGEFVSWATKRQKAQLERLKNQKPGKGSLKLG